LKLFESRIDSKPARELRSLSNKRFAVVHRVIRLTSTSRDGRGGEGRTLLMASSLAKTPESLNPGMS